MERKSRPPDADCILFLQFFNTPGNEITPGSDVVGKYFEGGRFGHDRPPYKLIRPFGLVVGLPLFEIRLKYTPYKQKWGGSWGMNHPGIEEGVKG